MIVIDGQSSLFTGLRVDGDNVEIFGMKILGFDYGIYSDAGTVNNVVIGHSSVAGNVISGNNTGIFFQYSNGLTIQDNNIGTDATGYLAEPNDTGIDLVSLSAEVSNAYIDNNIISGNTGIGLAIGYGNNIIENNIIGLDTDQAASLPNDVGIYAGGEGFIQTNIISGNNTAGIVLQSPFSYNNQLVIRANHIGASISLGQFPNGSGINSESSTGVPNPTFSDAIIIGGGSGDENVIAYNSGPAVQLNGDSYQYTQITHNEIYENGSGIELLDGADAGQSPPTIDFVGTTSVDGTIGTEATGPATIHVYGVDASGTQGQTPRGSVTVASGISNWSVTGSFDDILDPSELTATVTTDDFGTSQFTGSNVVDGEETIFEDFNTYAGPIGVEVTGNYGFSANSFYLNGAKVTNMELEVRGGTGNAIVLPASGNSIETEFELSNVTSLSFYYRSENGGEAIFDVISIAGGEDIVVLDEDINIASVLYNEYTYTFGTPYTGVIRIIMDGLTSDGLIIDEFGYQYDNNYNSEDGFALQFDGTDDYVDVTHDAALNLVTGDFAFEAWVYLHDNAFETILSKGDGNNSSFPTVYIFQIQSQRIALSLSDGSQSEWQTSETDITINEWHHVAVSYDGTSNIATFFLDGSIDGESTFSTVTDPSDFGDTQSMFIGKQGYSCDCNYFEGLIDEVRIWNATRTETEIADHLAFELLGNEVDLVAYYNFNDGSGSSELWDQTSNFYDGTLSGGMDEELAWVGGTNFGGANEPQITLTYPNGGETFIVGETVTITWEEFNFPETSTINLSRSTESGENPSVFASGTSSDLNGQYDWLVPDDPSEAYRIVIESFDPSLIDESDGDFSVQEVGVQANYALTFDGTDDYLTASGISAPSGDFTLEAWVNYYGSGTATYQTIIEFSGDAPWFGLVSDQLSIFQAGSDLTAFPENTWTHIAAVYHSSENTYDMYIGGEEVFLGSDASGSSFGGTELLIGGDPNGTEGFYGEIDEVRIWDYAKSKVEIQAEMSVELDGSETDLAAYFTFNEGSGSSAFDVVGGMEATLSNMDESLAWVSGFEPFTIPDFPTPGNALSFDGSDDRVDLPAFNGSEFAESFSIDFWVKPTIGSGGLNNILTIDDIGGTDRLAISYIPNDDYFQFSSAGGFINSSFHLEDDEWHYFVLTINSAGEAVLYQDGLILGKATDFVLPQNSDIWTVGADYDGADYVNHFKGELDELKIFNHVKEDYLVQADYLAFSVSDQTGLLRSYDFNDGEPEQDNTGLDVLKDLTINEEDGTLQNFSLSGSTSNWVASDLIEMTVVDPSIQASEIVVLPTSESSVQVSWSEGDGERRVVLVAEGSSGFPDTTGISYFYADPTYSFGEVTLNGFYAVYNGFDNETEINGLEPNIDYTVAVLETNGPIGFSKYSIDPSQPNNPVVFNIPASTVTLTEEFDFGLSVGSPESGFYDLPTGTWEVGQTQQEETLVFSGTGAARLDHTSESAYLITPSIDGASEVNFYVALPSAGDTDFEVLESLDGVTFENVVYSGSASTTTYSLVTINLVQTGSIVNLMIRPMLGSSDQDLLVDHFTASFTQLNVPPNLTAVVSVVDSYAVQIDTDVDEEADLYYVITTSDIAPDAGQVSSGLDENGDPAYNSGSFTGVNGFTSNQIGNSTETLPALTSNTTYYSYWVAEDGTGEVSEVVSTGSFTTLDDPAQITISTVSLADGTLDAGTNGNLIYQLQMDIADNDATFEGFFLLPQGDYEESDFVQFEILHSVGADDFSGATPLGTSGFLVGDSFAPDGSIGLPLSETYVAPTTVYLYISADISAGAIAGNSISIQAPLANGNFGFAEPSDLIEGTVSAGATFTIENVADDIPPSFFDSTPYVFSVTETSVNLAVGTDELSTLYVVALPSSDQAPDEQAVRNLQDASGNAVTSSYSSLIPSANTVFQIPVNNLIPATDYTAYLVIEDESGNINDGAPAMVSFSTTSPPTVPFITTWETTSTDESITIPTTGAGYNYNVNWGDGQTDTDITGDASHTYASPGIYTVEILGAFPRIYFNFGSEGQQVDKIKSVEQWGDMAWTHGELAFSGCVNLVVTATDAPDLAGVVSLGSMFRDCSALSGDFNHWDVSNIQFFGGMFTNASSFDSPLGDWNLESAVEMGNMLDGTNLSVTNYDNTLIGWADDSGGTETIPNGIVLGATGLTYSYSAEAARNQLVSSFDWSISGDGLEVTDVTAPNFVSTPEASTVLETTVQTTVEIDEAGTVYGIVLLSSDPVPSVTEVKSGTAPNGATLYSATSQGMNAYTPTVLTFESLTGNTEFTVYYVAEDDASNLSEEYETLTFTTATADITAPSVSVNVLTTNDQTPAISGLVDDINATITVTVGGNEYTATNRGDGTWELDDDVILSLAEGVYDVQVSAVDDTDNTGTDETINELTIDLTAPTVTVNTQVTNDISPALGGAIDDPTASISVNVNGEDYIATYTGSGSWSLPDGTLADLAEGVYEVEVTATDLAGNVGIDASSNELTIDLSAITVTVDLLITNDPTPALSGSVDDAEASITVTVAGSDYTATNNGNGTWSVSDNTIATLEEGVYDVVVTAADGAGNSGNDPSFNELTIDLTAPEVTVEQFITNVTSPELKGTIDDENATVTVVVDGQSLSATNDGLGNWFLSEGSLTALAEGIYDVEVQAQDAVGNIGTDQTNNELTVDLTSPTATVDNLETLDDAPPITGTISESANNVQVTIQGDTYAAIVTDLTWEVPDNSITSLEIGVYDVSVEVTDLAGNIGSDETVDELTILPGPPTAIAATDVQFFSFRANWNTRAGVEAYRVDVAKDAAFSEILENYNNRQSLDNFVDVTGLDYGTTYYYQVRAVLDGDASESSNIIEVTTATDPATAEDEAALLAIYNETAGSEWSPAVNWTEGLPLRDWTNVEVQGTTRAKSVDLNEMGLKGSVPAITTGLESLEVLDLGNNDLTEVGDLTGLTSLTSLILVGNKLEFGSLESNFEILGVRFNPQDSVGLYGESLWEIREEPYTISRQISGSDNIYTWYKLDRDGQNPTTVEGVTGPELDLTISSFEDEGYYYAEVASSVVTTVTLRTQSYFVKVSSLERDRVALTELYNATSGPQWTDGNSGADAWFSSDNVGDWFGVDLTDDQSRVGSIALPNNNLDGAVPSSLADISGLESVNFSDNDLTSFPNMSKVTGLTTLNLSTNRLVFKDILPNIAVQTFDYSEQKRFGVTVYDTLYAGGDQLLDDFVTKDFGDGTTFQWTFGPYIPGQFFNNNTEPISGATSQSYIIENIDINNQGTYRLVATHPQLPDLTVQSRNQNIMAKTDFKGSVSINDSPVTDGDVLIWRQTPSGPFVREDSTALDASGNYELKEVVLGTFLVVARPNRDLNDYESSIQTYYISAAEYADADELLLEGVTDGINIDLITYVITPPDPVGADISGFMEIDLPDPVDEENGRVNGRRRVKKAGCAMRRFKAQGRPDQDDVEEEIAYYVETDDEGYFNFEGIEDGKYLLTIEFPGVPLAEDAEVVFELGGDRENQVFDVNVLIDENGINVETEEILYTLKPYIKDIVLYPNPTEGVIGIDYNVYRDIDDLKLQLITTSGHTLIDQKIDHWRGNRHAEMDLTDYAVGVYYLVFTDEAGTFSQHIKVSRK
ncbi:MAG: LamG-like jellyroll fold domain-containing protein [Cyclobacteriaceae bacterium]